MTNIKPDNGMDPAVEGLEVVGYITNAALDMLKEEGGWARVEKVRNGPFMTPLVTHQSAQAAVQSAYQRGVLDERKHGDAAVAESRRTAEYWKAEHLAGNKRITQLEAALVVAREALEYTDAPLNDETVDEWELKTDAALAAIDSVGVTKT